MLLKRTITAVLLISLATFLAFYGDGFLFPLLILAFHFGIYMEWLTLLNASRAQKISGIMALIFIFVVVINVNVSQHLLLALLFSSFLFWFLVSPAFVLNKYRASKAMSVIVALIMCLASMIALYFAFLEGVMFLLSTLAVVWIIDTGAYITGKIFGHRKLLPTVSPNKTWEGVYGALFMYFIFSLFMVKIDGTWQEFVLYYFGTWWLVLLSIVLFFVAIFADLFESKLKRTSGKKDSGNILPGHGGLFDRFDATLAVGPSIVFFNIIGTRL
ncbi:MAG: hypothetical protein CMO42_03665 [Verrucomicrobiales bacterium]|nr:hypothetical protein [Verrucomicrobiales bacterium]